MENICTADTVLVLVFAVTVYYRPLKLRRLMKMTVVTGFCFGHLIHSGLMLGYQIVYLRAEGQEFYDCASIATLLLDVLYPVYSFLQLFFIFKYSNVSAGKEAEGV